MNRVGGQIAVPDLLTGTVTSVFGRSGDVVAQPGDYSASQIAYAVDSSQIYQDPTWIGTIRWSKITGAPNPITNSVFGRWGVIKSQYGDYDISQIINGVSGVIVYENPAFVGTLDWSKITNTPSFLSDPTTAAGDLIVQSGSGLDNLPIGTDGQVLTADSTQPLKMNWETLTWNQISGTPPPSQISGFQTPWLQNIDAAGFDLDGVDAIGVNGGVNSALSRVLVYAQGSESILRGQNVASNRSAAIILYNDDSSGSVQLGTNGSAQSNPGRGGLYSSKSLDFFAGGNFGITIFSPGPGQPNRILMTGATDDGISRLQVFGQTNIQAGNLLIASGYSAGIGKAPSYPLDVSGDCNITGVYRVNGVPISAGGGGGTPAGATGQVQFNNAGAFGASANHFWDNTNNRLGIGTSTPLVTLDLPTYLTNNSAVRVGTLEILPQALGITYITDNITNNGTNWIYRNSGYGVALNFGTGNFFVGTSPSGSAGATASITPRLYVANTGNVGIGTSGPISLLHVAGDATVSGTSGFRVCPDGNLVNTRARLYTLGNTASNAGYLQLINGAADANICGINLYNAAGSALVSIQCQGATTFLGGNVGIGTASPITMLDMPYANSQVRIGSLEFMCNALNSSNIVDNIYFTGSSWAYRNNGYGAMISLSNGTFGISLMPSGTAGANPGPNPNMKFMILNNGNVGIGTTSPAEALDVTSGGVIVRNYTVTNSPNAMKLDYYIGNARVISQGPNTATNGGFQVITTRSDGTGPLTPILISSAGGIQFLAWNSQPIADGSQSASSFQVWVNEVGNALTFRVKYSGGTLKTGTIALA